MTKTAQEIINRQIKLFEEWHKKPDINLHHFLNKWDVRMIQDFLSTALKEAIDEVLRAVRVKEWKWDSLDDNITQAAAKGFNECRKVQREKEKAFREGE